MKYPFFKQHESQDCGVACLRMICKYYGKDVSQQELAERCHTNKVGTSMLDLSDAANSIGLESAGASVTADYLFEKAELPCIALWKKNHYIVIYHVDEKKVTVGDPAIGLIKYPKDKFLQYWNSAKGADKGVVMLIRATEAFEKMEFETRNEKGMGMLKHVKPFRAKLVALGLTILVGSVISLAFPYLTGAMVDEGIASKDLHIVFLILLAQLCLTFGTFVTRYLGNWISLHTSSQISISLINDFVRKLTRLPMSFFDKRNIGDITTRIDDYGRIEHFLTSSIVSSVIAIVGFLVYASVLFSYGPHLLLVFLIGSVAYFFWILLFLRRRRVLDYMRFQELSSNESNVLELINGMQEIKLNGSEEKKCNQWRVTQHKIYKLRVKGLSLAQTQSIGGTLIDQTKNLIVSFLAAKGVIDGSISLGTMMAIQYIVGQLNTPMFQLIGFVSDYQDMKISTERVNDIYLRKDEERIEDYDDSQPIKGDMVMSDVRFQYGGRRSREVLKGISCQIPAGKVTAIVGASGSGKSTMMKLLLGFYRQTGGDITIGGRPFRDYDVSAWRRRCGVVLQEGYLFSDTILNNISLCDKEPDLERVKEACRLACIDKFIEESPLGYNTVIGPNGNTLSSGQKQRIMIARAIYKNAPYLFLDEATNSLDVNNEYCIMENLKKYYEGRTVLVIAHRLSTVKTADQILVVDSGQIIERGTHHELLALRGYYYNFIKEQLEMDQS